MSAEAENIPTNVASGDAEAAVTAKGAKAKKTKEVKPKKKPAEKKATKKKASSSPPSHPKYEEMIKDAITTLKERTGSSQYAIQKFIEEKEKSLPPTFRKLLLVNLKRLVAAEKLVKVKGSFKLPSAKSAPNPAAVKKKPAAVAKPKAKVAAKAPVKAKPAAKVAKKPAAAAAKPKAAKPKAKTKTKTVAAVSKTKAVAVKPKAKERPTKAARTSSRTSPGKKAAPAKKTAAATKKVAPVKSVKPKTVKSPAKRASTRKEKEQCVSILIQLHKQGFGLLLDAERKPLENLQEHWDSKSLALSTKLLMGWNAQTRVLRQFQGLICTNRSFGVKTALNVKNPDCSILLARSKLITEQSRAPIELCVKLWLARFVFLDPSLKLSVRKAHNDHLKNINPLDSSLSA
ncbi:hypothetical protein F2Q69_00001409 [Brassica cretica]|uniref:H15 domain-containing protein n=2 Tax=Brassica TaxID=3705 RepID=A0A8S9P1B4_BRACR|nr:hypothetical protein F2Q69_00001409 [Brassica cretica]